MNKSSLNRSAQSGFTLIELIVVIVILGVLAATALPRFADLGGDARVASMRAAVGAVRSASAMAHGSWLAGGSPVATDLNTTAVNSVITAEGARVAVNFGYADVGGDGFTNSGTNAAASGIVVAAGGLASYNLTATPATATVLTVRLDADTTGTHANCFFTYTESTGANVAPVINAANITLANCP